MNGAPPPLKRIDHIVALVADLDTAFATYTKSLGLPISWQVESKDGWRSSAVWLGNASLELLEPSADNGATEAFFQRALDSRGEGLFLVAFEPVEIDYSVKALRRRGARRSLTRFPAPSLTPGEKTALAATVARSSTAAARPASTHSSASTTRRSHHKTEVKDP